MLSHCHWVEPSHRRILYVHWEHSILSTDTQLLYNALQHIHTPMIIQIHTWFFQTFALKIKYIKICAFFFKDKVCFIYILTTMDKHVNDAIQCLQLFGWATGRAHSYRGACRNLVPIICHSSLSEDPVKGIDKNIFLEGSKHKIFTISHSHIHQIRSPISTVINYTVSQKERILEID